ncbi:MAG TPA: site-2 protease family protein [Planctomycetota bacterium]|nr:site-2 protease family protein [Planctomycetota bacterium]
MRSFKIGSVFGIELRIDWSWLLIVLLIVWNLATLFASWHPDWPRAGTVSMAVAAALLFFVCIVLHELAHSLVARKHGMRVRSITLFLFGGVSNIEQEPPSAETEFLVAVVGPVTSVLLGAAFLFIASATTDTVAAESALSMIAQLSALSTLLFWLGTVNIVIGVFNLIPAFPLDGGRILRAAIWHTTGNLRKATAIASTSGQLFGWGLMLAGIAMCFGIQIPFLGVGPVSGVWAAFIGWFLRGSARHANMRQAIDQALAGMRVRQLMRRDVPAVEPELTVAQLVERHLVPGDDRVLPVMREGSFAGIVSAADVHALPEQSWATTTVGSIARQGKKLPVTTPERPLLEAYQQLLKGGLEQIPVIAGGQLAGMLRRRDVTRFLEQAVEVLRSKRLTPAPH